MRASTGADIVQKRGSWISSLSLVRKGLLILSIPLVCQVVFLSGLGLLVWKEQTEKDRARHAEAVIATTTRLLDRYYAAGRALLLYTATKSGMVDAQYEKAKQQIREAMVALEDLVADRKHEKQIVERFKILESRMAMFLDEAKASVDASGSVKVFFEKSQFDDELQELLVPMIDLISQIGSREDAEAGRDKDVEFWSDATKWFIIIGVPLDIMVSIAAAVVIFQNTSQRLRIVMDNNLRLVARKPLHDLVEGTDEIAVVDRTFHDAARALEQLDQIKRDFLNMISHDLRTPLTTVQLLLEMIVETDTSEDRTAHSLAGSALKEVERILALANELLDVEKIAAGQFDLQPLPTSIDSVMSRSVDAVLPLAKSLGIGIELEESQLLAVADQRRITQVVINLLSNALKFSAPGSTIRISSYQTADGFVQVDVADEGRGIPAGLEERIFERFTQVERKDATEKGGAGLGLFICKMIIEGHGGKIKARRNEGRGSTFSFTLPWTDRLPLVEKEDHLLEERV
jgi:signal transduction histidine kinase